MRTLDGYPSPAVCDTPLTHLARYGFVPGQETIVDSYGRTFAYLRVSVTDRCNLRCVYCMPENGVPWLPPGALLSFEEICAVVEAATACGAHKVRLTGGEPLVRKGVETLVKMISGIPGVSDLSLTTNGIRLAELAKPLAQAGLRRINVSLDTLNPDRFRRVTRGGRVEDVFAGLQAAEDAGLCPIKLNFVVLGGVNDDEVADIAALTIESEVDVRFIEYMPLQEAKECAMGSGAFSFLSNTITRQRIEMRFGSLIPEETGEAMRGPAEMWRAPNARGRIGFVSAMSAPFCARCDRLRLTATGALRSCLLDGGGIDVKQILRRGGTRADLMAALRSAAHMKPEYHKPWSEIPSSPMNRLGG